MACGLTRFLDKPRLFLEYCVNYGESIVGQVRTLGYHRQCHYDIGPRFELVNDAIRLRVEARSAAGCCNSTSLFRASKPCMYSRLNQNFGVYAVRSL